MRIPFPERVNLSYALIFATGLFVVQVLEATNIFFACCVFCTILVAAVGFNVAGGLPYPSGAFIGFNAIFTIILPMVVKVFLGDAADSHLRTPLRTIEVYLLGMVSMFAACVFSRRFRRRRAVIAGLLPVDSLKSAYVGCVVISILIFLYLSYLSRGGDGSFGSFLVQANRFPILTFVLGVIYTIHRTNGERSVSLPLLGMMLFMSLGAFLTFSKEQLLTPFFAWAVTAALLRYRLHWGNVVLFFVGMYFVVVYMVPYAQVGRDFQYPGYSRIQISGYLLTHMDEVRATYNEGTVGMVISNYYNRPLGLLNRLEVISGDDALIDLTDREGPYGYQPIVFGFENVIPHFLFPNKPKISYGNVYAHQIGILPPDDNDTGVSFSPSSDAYHEGRLTGVLLVEPLMLMLIFVVLDSVLGDVRRNPVGLLATILISRAASEGALWFTPALIGQYLFTNVLAAYICAYVLPMLGSIFSKTIIGPAERPLLNPVHDTASP
jgi:hypothetical protein